MHSRGTPFIAIGMMLAGIVGMIAVLMLWDAGRDQRAGSVGGGAGFSSNGERIYYTGVGHRGPITVRWIGPSDYGDMMGRSGRMGRRAPGCVNCHGEDGRGGRLGMMAGGIEAPDIRYSSLSSPQDETSGTIPGWNLSEIERAIRDGIEPDGTRLSPIMPRWRMDRVDMSDTIGYLKELSVQ